MKLWNWQMGVLATSVALAACGDDPGKNNGDNNGNNGMTNNGMTNNGMTNNGMTNNGMTNNGMTNNGMTNNGMTNNGMTNNGNPTADVSETEPNSFADAPNSFNWGQSVGGIIATGAGDTSDDDTFGVDLTQGFVEFEIQEGPGLAGHGVVVLIDEEQSFLVRLLETSTGLNKRQVYVPIDGRYILGIWDDRWEGGEQHGGDDAWYVISTSTVDVAPSAIAVPGNAQADQSDGSIQSYSWTATEDTAVVVETVAARDPIASTLDTYVWVLDSAGEIVSASDNLSDETTDSSATFAATTGEAYTFIVDAITASNDGTYSISTATTDDAISAPTTLAVDVPFDGVIDAKDGAEFDTDYFVISVAPGQTLRVMVDGAGGLEPTVTVAINSFFGLIPFAIGYPVGPSAAIEFTHPSDADAPEDYLLFVDDLRNIEDPENPADVGEPGFTYQLLAQPTTWASTTVTLPYTTPGSIPNIGNYTWYNITVPAGTMFSAGASSANANFSPVIAIQGEGGSASVMGSSYAFFPAMETAVTIGVRDEFFRGGAGYDFTPAFRTFDLSAITFAPVAEVEPNDSMAAAQAITAPAGVTGMLDGAGTMDLKPDWFKVSATTGQTIGVVTEAGADANTDDADTVVQIFASDGTTVLAENDDYDGQASTFFSAVLATAAADGDYYVVVTPYCTGDMDCSGNGDYTANVFVQ